MEAPGTPGSGVVGGPIRCSCKGAPSAVERCRAAASFSRRAVTTMSRWAVYNHSSREVSRSGELFTSSCHYDVTVGGVYREVASQSVLGSGAILSMASSMMSALPLSSRSRDWGGISLIHRKKMWWPRHSYKNFDEKRLYGKLFSKADRFQVTSCPPIK